MSPCVASHGTSHNVPHSASLLSMIPCHWTFCFTTSSTHQGRVGIDRVQVKLCGVGDTACCSCLSICLQNMQPQAQGVSQDATFATAGATAGGAMCSTCAPPTSVPHMCCICTSPCHWQVPGGHQVCPCCGPALTIPHTLYLTYLTLCT
jgi:hypothetical protein